MPIRPTFVCVLLLLMGIFTVHAQDPNSDLTVRFADISSGQLAASNLAVQEAAGEGKTPTASLAAFGESPDGGTTWVINPVDGDQPSLLFEAGELPADSKSIQVHLSVYGLPWAGGAKAVVRAHLEGEEAAFEREFEVAAKLNTHSFSLPFDAQIKSESTLVIALRCSEKTFGLQRVEVRYRSASGSSSTVSPAFDDPVTDSLESGTFEVVPADDYERAAVREWRAIADKTDIRALDWFIARFSRSAMAPVAFGARFEQVRLSQSIPVYNAFISAYPDYGITPVAIHEVYELYRMENRFPGYLDFLRRYPTSPHALVCRMRAQALLFEFVSQTDQVGDYDDFLSLFPDAPQVEAVIRLAETRAAKDEAATISTEEAHIQAAEGLTEFQRTSEKREWRRGRANELLVTFQDCFTEPDAYGGERSALILAGRLEHILKTHYARTDAATRVREEARHQELVKKLDAIRETLIANHNELVGVLREEFARTRKSIREGLVELGRTIGAGLDRLNATLESGFARLEESMNVLHTDLISINETLVTIHAELKDIGGVLRETNRKLDGLGQKLDAVNRNLRDIHRGVAEMHRDMNKNFKEQAEAVKNLTREVSSGFARQEAIGRQQLEVSRQVLATNQAQLKVGVAQLVETRGMRADQQAAHQREMAAAQAQLQETRRTRHQQAAQHVQAMRSMHEIKQTTQAGFDAMGRKLDKGFHDVQQTMYAGFSRVEQAQRENTAALKQGLGKIDKRLAAQAKAQQRARQRNRPGRGNGSIGGFLGKMASHIPVVGPLVAPAVEAVTNGVIEGKDFTEVARDAVVATVDEHLGGAAGQMAGALYDTVTSERHQSFTETLIDLGGRYGIGKAQLIQAAKRRTREAAMSYLSEQGVPPQALRALSYAADHFN